MPQIQDCSFCKRPIPPGTGIIFVRRDGRTLKFCSSKCRKSMLKLNRDPRKFKWTKVYMKR
ncbi:50S ribosomal protein L24e [Candidatus Bathyarchaeota archaeon]|nr:50S ribosomal protein L24e [Candidatus Bathyarchaeota archaeon]MBS7631936.1 50S ribosomal protein L24e [Candidatus Bathyarchaeota archaeon]